MKINCEGCQYEYEENTYPICTNCVRNAIDNYTPEINLSKIRELDAIQMADFLSQIGCVRNHKIASNLKCYGDCGHCQQHLSRWLLERMS